MKILRILSAFTSRSYARKDYAPDLPYSARGIAIALQALFGAGVFSIIGSSKAKQDLKYVREAEEALRRDYIKEPYLIGRSDKAADYEILKKVIY